MREYFRELLIEGGAKDVRTVFLHCEKDILMRAVWNRYLRLAEQGGIAVETLLEYIGAPVGSVTDFDSFSTWYDSVDTFEGPDADIEPSSSSCKVVDVSAKDVTVMDSLDEACLGGVVGLDDSNNNRFADGLTYEELVQKIKRVDEERDATLIEQAQKEK